MPMRALTTNKLVDELNTALLADVPKGFHREGGQFLVALVEGQMYVVRAFVRFAT